MFSEFARLCSKITGHYLAFFFAILSIVLWGFSGFLLGFNDTWQLIINTTTTIITFLLVILIQNTQNQDTIEIKAILHQLLKAVPEASENEVEKEIKKEGA